MMFLKNIKLRPHRCMAIALLMLISSVSVSFAIEINADSRGRSLGGVTSLIGRDVNATTFNPALLALQEDLRISVTFDTKFEPNQNQFSFLTHAVVPIKFIGPIGLSVGVLGFHLDPNAAPIYNEVSFDVGYAIPLKSKIFQIGAVLSIDSIFINRNFISTAAYENIQSGSTSFNYGIGVNYQFHPTANVVFILGDFLRATQLIFGSQDATTNLSSEFSYIRTGIAKKIKKIVDLGLAVNYTFQKNELGADLGVEARFLKQLLRARARVTAAYILDTTTQNSSSSILGVNGFSLSLALGIGVRFSAYKLDYSFEYNIGQYDFGNHHISFGVAF